MYSNVTASLPVSLVAYINEKAEADMSSKSDVIRTAILKMKEQEFWANLMEASADAKAGRTFKGDLDKLVALID